MKSTVDFLMVTQLNQLLKEKGIEYSLHTVGGCSCCGLHLRQDGEKANQEMILSLVNEYLATKWLIASYQIDDLTMLYIDSKFGVK